MKINIFTVLLFCIFYCNIFAQRNQEAIDGTLETTPVVWKEGKSEKKAYLCKNEMAVFVSEPERTDSLMITRAFDPSAKIIKQRGKLYILQSEACFSPDVLKDKVQFLSEQKNIQYVSFVFYQSLSKNPATRLIAAQGLIVRYVDTISSEQITEIESKNLLERDYRFSFVPQGFLYKTKDVDEAIRLAEILSGSSSVLYAYPNWIRHLLHRAVPDDTYYPRQWHLKNTGQYDNPALVGTPNEDIANGQIESVWDTYRGKDKVIAVMDDGLEINHEDLTTNVLKERCWNYKTSTTDTTGGAHGTCVAGCIAARGFNGKGVTGVAPYGSLIGYLFLDSGVESDDTEAECFLRNIDVVDVHNNSWGPADGYGLLEDSGPLVKDALKKGTSEGRKGKGIIYVWAGGNGGDDDNSNCDGYANNRHVIAAAASDFQGKRVSYSEKGANILVNSPVGDPDLSGPLANNLGVMTVDRTGVSEGYNDVNDPPNTAYYARFNGTSSAAPILSGCIALILEANPNLGWRDLQHVLIESATKNDPGDSDWTTNAAGKNINHKYGFGRVNVKRAIEIAQTWRNVVPEAYFEASDQPNLPIPDNDREGVESTVEIGYSTTVEHVEVFFSASDHTYWTDLQVELTSPQGTKSLLVESLPVKPRTPSFNNWKFMTVRHWGENSKGLWKLTVRDLKADYTGTFQAWKLIVYGPKQTYVIHVDGGGGGGCSPLRSEPPSYGYLFPFLILGIALALMRYIR